MTLDEAIKYCEEKAEEQRSEAEKAKRFEKFALGCLECAKEHEQLAEWLKELKAYKETPKGEWEDSHIYSCGKILKGRNDVIEHKCSVCKRWSIKWDGTIPDNYCSHCGADMRGEDK